MLRSVAFFLRKHAGVPRFEVCPYELPIVVLGRFFSIYSSPSERSLILLKRWLWRGSIAERLGGASSSIQNHVDDIVERDESGSVRRLLDRTGSPQGVALDPQVWSRFSLANARGKMQVCALLGQQPRHLVTGDRLDPCELFREGASAVLQPIVPSGGEALGASVANRLLHPAGPQRASRLLLSCDDEAALMSHGIDAESIRALRAGDANAFLEGRAAILERWLRAFFDLHAECQRDDAPSVATLARRSA